MFKKLFFVAVLWIFFFKGFSLALYYDFSHYPTKYTEKITPYIKNWYEYLKYDWDADFHPRICDLSIPLKYLENIGYFKFLKFWYYWEDALWRIKDEKIDLDYLQDRKLFYPILWVYTKDYILIFIHERQIKYEDRKRIWYNYVSEDLRIQKEWRWYITSLYTTKKTWGFNYDSSKYVNLLEKLYEYYDLITFQMWQNPYNRYDIQGYTDNFLQVELFSYGELRGIIISLKKMFSLSVDPTEWDYWESYKQDEWIMNKLLYLRDNIESYYIMMWWIPDNITSLSPNFLDISSLNKYSHELLYQRKNSSCYKIWFKPKSFWFKKYFWYEINSDGFWTESFCLN